MNRQTIFAIMRKDLLTLFQNKGVWMPILLVPVILLIILPAAVLLGVGQFDMIGETMSDLRIFFDKMPPAFAAQFDGLSTAQMFVKVFALYFFAPFFLIVPLMVSSVIGADSFAGEKERKTLEALLYTPATDTELFLGKVLTALVPSVAVSWASFVLYGLVVNLAGWSLMGEVFFPNAMWVVMVLWVVPAAAALGLGVMVLVSSKVKGFQEANQIGGVVVVPILLLFYGQMAGVLYFNVAVVLIIGAVLWLVAGVIIWLSVHTFRRGELIARL